MNMKQVYPQTSEEWNKVLLRFPQAHVLQSWEWAEAKKQNEWTPSFFVWEDHEADPIAAALLLKRQISFLGLRFSVLYAPKGPVLDWDNLQLTSEVITDLQNYYQTQNSVFLKIDPDVLLGTGLPGTDEDIPAPKGLAFQSELQKQGWQFSQDQIQFRNTVLLDLTQSEDELLAAMKQKTRYNIRLSGRKGVEVRSGDLSDLPMLYRMYAETAVRDDFVIRHEDYYLKTWSMFIESGMAEILIAEVEGQPIAALILFLFNEVSRYMFGMSTEAYRELMPNYLLQWEAIRLSKERGCHTYDMWGAPDVFDSSDPMWGVFRFKQGFHGFTVRYLGAWDFTARPLIYKAYTQTLPGLLNLMRKRGKSENRKKLQND